MHRLIKVIQGINRKIIKARALNNGAGYRDGKGKWDHKQMLHDIKVLLREEAVACDTTTKL